MVEKLETFCPICFRCHSVLVVQKKRTCLEECCFQSCVLLQHPLNLLMQMPDKIIDHDLVRALYRQTLLSALFKKKLAKWNSLKQVRTKRMLVQKVLSNSQAAKMERTFLALLRGTETNVGGGGDGVYWGMY